MPEAGHATLVGVKTDLAFQAKDPSLELEKCESKLSLNCRDGEGHIE